MIFWNQFLKTLTQSNMKTLVFLILLFLVSSLQAGEKYWIYFKDKNQSVAKQQVTDVFSERALAKRAISGKSFDWYDFSVRSDYISAVENLGLKIEHTSRWLNAVSVHATLDQLSSVRSLPFVEKLEPVASFKVIKDLPENDASVEAEPLTLADPDYGTSLSQLSQTNLVSLHTLGITGKGLFVGLLDAGTRWRNNIAFPGIRVVDEYDFVEKDSDASGDDSHGTSVLSLMGANLPGTGIGGTFGSSFLIGKTEYSPTETRIEEDNWVAGIEWMDAKGADVVNSSLGYTTFDDGSGYFYSNGDLDGKTAKVTIAADIAAKEKGIAVFISAGNEGSTKVGTLNAPSDGFYVFSSGAVDVNSTLASFSSTGPTNDGRIKPDGCSRGVNNWIAKPGDKNNPNGYFAYGSGTSYASPLSASAGALILSVYPELTPLQLNDALRTTASRSSNPDNKYGYGILNALNALYSIGPAVSNTFSISYNPSGFDFSGKISWDEPIDPSQTTIKFYQNSLVLNTSSVVTISGNEVTFHVESNPAVSDTLWFEISGKTTTGKSFIWPLKPEYRRFFVAGKAESETGKLRRSSGRFTDSTEISGQPTTFLVENPYPNPFNPSTRFKVLSPDYAPVTVRVFNALGQQVDGWSGKLVPGTNYLNWDPSSLSVVPSSGVYFLSVSSGSSRQLKSVVFLR